MSDQSSEPAIKNYPGIEVEPPADLENRVVQALLARRLIRADRPRGIGWQAIRVAMAAAACMALVALGFVLGSTTGPSTPITQSGPVLLTGAETDLFALLLYETVDYRPPQGKEVLGRYNEYSHWVAKARNRRQFVTGEALEVDQGWLISAEETDTRVQSQVRVAAGAPLSGMFFIRADNVDHALELARELPHVKYGGSVLVQRVVPTDTPPSAASS